MDLKRNGLFSEVLSLSGLIKSETREPACDYAAINKEADLTSGWSLSEGLWTYSPDYHKLYRVAVLDKNGSVCKQRLGTIYRTSLFDCYVL